MTFVPFADEQLQELEGRFRRIAVVRAKAPARSRWAKPTDPDPEPPWEAVFRAPTPGESDAFEGATTDESKRAGALRTLGRQIVVALSYGGKQVVHDGEKRSKAETELRALWDRVRADGYSPHIAAQNDFMTLMGAQREEEGKD